ncbi:MAG: hypothetical protein NC099_06360 [Corallococcus sp.]|nr:hypothetical protein [Bacillota bacterium]MCM1534256.1 hypothetical protein [Corallococcus sp.]
MKIIDNEITVCDLSFDDAERIYLISQDDDNKRFMPTKFSVLSTKRVRQ